MPEQLPDAIEELEIFRAGAYGDKGTWTAEDLDKIATSYDKSVHEAPVTLDHAQEGPARGWVDRLWRVGNSLYASIRDLAPELASSIRTGAFRKRSAEIYRDFQGKGQPYLRALSFLGAQVPAVKGMADIVLSDDEEYVAIDEEPDRSDRVRLFLAFCGSHDITKEDLATAMTAMRTIDNEPANAFAVMDEIYNRYQEVRKTEDGVRYPAEAYLYVPDKEKPSTWKLRIWDNLEDKVTRAQLGRAVAALSPGGFRGRRVELPPGQVAVVKRKLRGLYRQIGVEAEDLPAVIRAAEAEDTPSWARRVIAAIADLRAFMGGANASNLSEVENKSSDKGDKPMAEDLAALQEKLEASEGEKESLTTKLKEATTALDAAQKELSELRGAKIKEEIAATVSAALAEATTPERIKALGEDAMKAFGERVRERFVDCADADGLAETVKTVIGQELEYVGKFAGSSGVKDLGDSQDLSDSQSLAAAAKTRAEETKKPFGVALAEVAKEVASR